MAAVEFDHAADGTERRANRFVFAGVFIAFGEILGPNLTKCLKIWQNGYTL